MSVVNIENNRPHVTGNAQCRRCAYVWVAVIAADANLWLLECPKCGRLYGHVVGAFPESPYEAKVWSEEMWCYLMYEELPGKPVDVQGESQTDTDGSAGSADAKSSSGGVILTVDRSRWTTSSRSCSEAVMPQPTSGQPTSDATGDAGGGPQKGVSDE